MDKKEILDLEEFLRGFKAADHHLEHYNHLVLYELPNMIQNLVTILNNPEYKIEITFTNVRAGKASFLENGAHRAILPQECRRKDLSYMAPLYATVIQKKTLVESGEVFVTVFNKIISYIPVMVGSILCNLRHGNRDECPNDPKGYFIVNGIERVIVTQEINAYNFTQVVREKDMYVGRMRSMSEDTGHSVLIQCSTSAIKPISESARFTLPYLSKAIPIAILFKALGIANFEEVYRGIGIKNINLYRELETAYELAGDMSQEDALYFMGQFASKQMPKDADEEVDVDEDDAVADDDEDDGDAAALFSGDESETVTEVMSIAEKDKQKRAAYARQILETELFPHLGVCAAATDTIDTLYHMLKYLFSAHAGALKPSERDNLMYKRFENSGMLLLNLYRICFKHHLATLKKNYSGSAPDDMVSKLCAFVTKTVKNNLATGTWGIQKNAYVRHGVAQVLSRLSYIGTLSHLQRVAIPIGKEGKNTKVRMIHPSEFGYICLYETPEGKTCGIVINMTICARITRNYTTNYIRDLFLKLFTLRRAPTSEESVELWLNNTLRYFIDDEPAFMARFRELRVRGVIPNHVNIYKERPLNIIYVFSDAGRITRPVYDRAGNVVWLDAAESQAVEVAMYSHESPRFSYVEIHPSLLYGIAAGCIPFSDHMQSPRNVYESSMIKQALGIFAYSYRHRYDSSYEVMETVQRTLVSTSIARAVGCPEMPASVNCIVAIMTAGSWNAEDSLVFNRAAIDRGLFRSITFKVLTVEEYKPDSSIVKTFCLPEESVRNPMLNYSLLDDRGIVKVGARVQKKDVIIGRVLTTKTGSKDVSETSDEEGVVSEVDVFRNVNGYRTAKIRLKILKIPRRGDKFANMCAQKGTVGMIFEPEDMPFTADGIIPEILINPNAMPSRMTIAMFIEMVLGKHCALSGEFGDATPFSQNSTNVADLLKGLLVQHGFEDHGYETMISGTTGEMFPVQIFIGCTEYQKLKHMVEDKIHARPFGNVTTLTRQPPAGRSKDGGLRMGEMERDVALAAGASTFLTSRLFDRSDAFHVAICNACQVLSNHKDECHLCKSTDLIWARLPFASKLLFQQLKACLIGTKFSAELF